jgi:hypothetical protein
VKLILQQGLPQRLLHLAFSLAGFLPTGKPDNPNNGINIGNYSFNNRWSLVSF